MTRSIRSLSILAAATLLLTVSAPASVPASVPAPGEARHAEPAPALHTRALDLLGLRAGEVVSLDLPRAINRLDAVSIAIDGRVRVLDLHPHSVRAADFTVYETRADGSLREVDPGAPGTLRGTVRDEPGSRVAASMTAAGLSASIRIGDDRYWLEPLAGRVDGAAPDHHVVYRAEDARDPGPSCGTPSLGAEVAEMPGGFDGGAQALGAACAARLACEADYYYFLDWGAGTQARIEFIVNQMNMQFEDQVGITHDLGDVVIHTSLDPYPPPGTLAAGDLLCWFSVWWTNFRPDIQRDLAHLFTGRSLLGDFDGYATIASVCQVFGCPNVPCACGGTDGIAGAYSVAQSDVGNNAFSVALTTHMVAHNWNALHCDGLGCCPGGTMCSSVGTSGVFSAAARYRLLAFKEVVPCLDCPAGCAGTPETETVLAADRQDGDRAGRSVANAGDVDNDGCDDYIIGAADADSARGKAYVYSGADGTLIYLLAGENVGDRFGWAVAGIGDANLDGFDDFLVGAPYFQDQRGRSYVFSGFDGSELFRKSGKNNQRDRHGYSVAGRVDVDNDGHVDFIIGEPHNDDAGNKAGRARVYSGDTGSTLRSLRGARKGDRFGWSVAGIGRVNNDNHDDVAVGAPRNDDEAGNAGKVYVYSGDDFGLIYAIAGLEAGDQFGRSIAATGELDYDGRDDFAVGSPYYDKGARRNAGRVDVFSGRFAAILWSRKGPAENDRLGWSIASGVDVDGDLLSDVIIGVPRNDAIGTDSGRIYIRSGYNGCSIARLDGSAGDQLGYSVAMLPGGCGNDPVALAGAPNHDDAQVDAGWVVQVAIDDGPAPDPPAAAAAHLDLGRPADLDGDGAVSASDLAILLGRWGACAPCPEDLNGDGRVDAQDLLEMVAAW